MVAARIFGYSLISVFLPIYIFLIRDSFLDVLTFLTFVCIGAMIFFPIVGKITSKIGNIHSILISAPLMILFFYTLQTFDPLIIGLPILGFLLGVQEAFFWMPFHEEFSFISKSKELGQEISIVKIVIALSGALAPFIGALLLMFFDFNFLFLVVLLIISMGAIPLLFSKEIKPKQKMKLKNIFSKKNRKFFLPFFGSGSLGVFNGWLWPILIFLILQNFLEIGSFSMIVNIFALISFTLLAFKLKKVNKDKLRIVGTILFSLSILVSAFVRNSFEIILIWIIFAIFHSIFSVMHESKIYEKSKHNNKLEFFVVREWAIGLGRLFILAMAFLFVYDINLALTVGILVSGFLVLLTLKL